PRILAAWLAAHRAGQAVVRIATPALAPPIEPLTVPIEPLLINSRDPTLRALAPNSEKHSERGRGGPGQLSLFGMVLLGMVTSSVITVSKIGIDSGWPYFGLLTIVALVPLGFVYLRYVVAGSPQWLIVNGGILLRRHHRLACLSRTSWSLVVFSP